MNKDKDPVVVALEALKNAKEYISKSSQTFGYVLFVNEAIAALSSIKDQQAQPSKELYDRLLKSGYISDRQHFTKDSLLDYVIEVFAEYSKPVDQQAQPDKWKESVLDLCAITHMPFHEDNPRKTIDDLIAWHCAAALDPKVSNGAQALIDKGRFQQAQPVEQYKVNRNGCECHPETCCCNDWAIYDADGNKHSTYFDRSTADQVADSLNITNEKKPCQQCDPSVGVVCEDCAEAPVEQAHGLMPEPDWRTVVGRVCEGYTLPDAVRKQLETLLHAAPQAPAKPEEVAWMNQNGNVIQDWAKNHPKNPKYMEDMFAEYNIPLTVCNAPAQPAKEQE